MCWSRCCSSTTQLVRCINTQGMLVWLCRLLGHAAAGKSLAYGACPEAVALPAQVITEQPYIAQLVRCMESQGVLPVPIFINGEALRAWTLLCCVPAACLPPSSA